MYSISRPSSSHERGVVTTSEASGDRSDRLCSFSENPSTRGVSVEKFSELGVHLSPDVSRPSCLQGFWGVTDCASEGGSVTDPRNPMPFHMRAFLVLRSPKFFMVFGSSSSSAHHCS